MSSLVLNQDQIRAQQAVIGYAAVYPVFLGRVRQIELVDTANPTAMYLKAVIGSSDVKAPMEDQEFEFLIDLEKGTLVCGGKTYFLLDKTHYNQPFVETLANKPINAAGVDLHSL